MAAAAEPDPFASGVVAVLHPTSVRRLLETAAALSAGGVRTLEVTLRGDGALEAIAHLCARLGDEVSIGAGTVLDGRQAEAAIAVGAAFLISPGLALDVLERGRSHDVPAVPGVLTPTEAMAARAAGARVAKLFPAGALGPRYVRDLLGPFPDLRLMPTGGITLDAAPEYLAAGAVAVGIGKPLAGDPSDSGNLAEIERRARRLTQLVAPWHG